MKLLINLLFCLVAGLLVYAAPDRYNYEFCVVVLLLYIVNVVYYYFSNRTITGNAANFEFFFMFSYGMTNFIYPVFYKPYNPNYTVFDLPFNFDIISKSTSIAYLGFTFFVLGISFYRKRMKQDKKILTESLPDFKVSGLFVRSIFVIALISFIGYVATGGLALVTKVYSGTDETVSLEDVGIYSYFNNIFVICANLLAVFVFLVKDKMTRILTFVLIAFCGLVMLTTGSRTLILGLGLILISCYGRYYKRIKIGRLLLLLIVGSIFMTFIQISRTQEFSEGNWTENATKNVEYDNPLDIFNDLIVNNRNLYILVDFADKTESTYLLSAVSDITSPVPGLFGYILKNIDVPKELLSGGALPTFIDLGPGSTWGLGTNLVGETYVGFSYFGVVIIMFLLGYLLKRTYQASSKNIYAFVLYFLLVSHAVFFPRAFYLYQPRIVVWSFLLVFLLLKFTNSITRKKKISEVEKQFMLTDSTIDTKLNI